MALQSQGDGGRIVNPYAREILKFTMNDQGQVQLESVLPPLEIAAQLMTMALRTIFRHIDVEVEKAVKERSAIERP